MRVLNRSSLTESVTSAIAWGQALSIIRLGLSFIYSIIIIRALTPDDYGLYAFLYSILITSSVIISIGFEGVVSRFASEFHASGESSALSHLFSELVSWRLCFLGISSFILFVFSSRIALVLNNPAAQLYIHWLGPLLIVQNVRMFLNNFHYALLKTRYAEAISVLERLVAISLSILFLLLWDQNLWAVMGALFVSECTALLLLAISTSHYWYRLSLTISILSQKHIRSMALNSWGMDLLTYGLSTQLAVLLISMLLSNNTQIAFYTIGTNLLAQITSVAVSNWKSVPLPALSQVKVTKGDPGVIQGWQLFLKLFSFVLLPVLFFLLFNADPIVSLLYGEGYLYSARIMQIGTIFFIIAVASGFWSTIGALYTLNAQNELLRLRIWTGLGNIILILILIPLIGIWGAAIASPLVATIGNWFEFRLLRRYLDVSIPWRFICFLSLNGVISGIISLIIPATSWFDMSMRMALYGASFSVLLFLSKPLEADESIMAQKSVPRFSYLINLISKT